MARALVGREMIIHDTVELTNFLLSLSLAQPQPVVIRTDVKTGYDEGDIYESEEFEVKLDRTDNGYRVVLRPRGQKLVGGW